MTLAEKLQAKLYELAPMVPGFVQRMMRKADDDLAAGGLIEKAKKVGDAAPDFELPDHEGNVVKLADLLADGPVVLSFYRGGWCPFCQVELAALREALGEINAAGARLVAVTPALPERTMVTAMKHELEFPILSDAGNGVARRFGLVFALDPNLRPLYRQIGVDLADFNGSDTWEIPVPATYVINKDGTIRFAYVNTDYKQRAEPTDIIAAIKELAN